MSWWHDPYEDKDVEEFPFFCGNCNDDRTGHGWIGKTGPATLTCDTCGETDDNVELSD